MVKFPRFTVNEVVGVKVCVSQPELNGKLVRVLSLAKGHQLLPNNTATFDDNFYRIAGVEFFMAENALKKLHPRNIVADYEAYGSSFSTLISDLNFT